MDSLVSPGAIALCVIVLAAMFAVSPIVAWPPAATAAASALRSRPLLAAAAAAALVLALALISALFYRCRRRPSPFGGWSSASGLALVGSLWRRRDEPGTPPERGAVGLQNLGNSCYQNATLQALAAIAEVDAYFIGGNFEAHREERERAVAEVAVTQALWLLTRAGLVQRPRTLARPHSRAHTLPSLCYHSQRA